MLCYPLPINQLEVIEINIESIAYFTNYVASDNHKLRISIQLDTKEIGSITEIKDAAHLPNFRLSMDCLSEDENLYGIEAAYTHSIAHIIKYYYQRDPWDEEIADND